MKRLRAEDGMSLMELLIVMVTLSTFEVPKVSKRVYLSPIFLARPRVQTWSRSAFRHDR